MEYKRTDPVRVYAPPGANTTIPEKLPPPGVRNPGLYKNLCQQVTSIYKHCNEKSHALRKRNYEATKRFCRFLADNYRLEKFRNVEDRHFRAYVKYLKESGYLPNTIQSDLSGIRFFIRLSGSKNEVSLNKRMDLPRREAGSENRAWLPEEKEKAKAIAERMGRNDVVTAIDFIDAFGLRLEEMCVTKVEYLMSALRIGQFVVPKGKGGQRRAILLNPSQRALIARYLDYAKTMGLQLGDYLISGSEKHGVKHEIKSLQNWMSHNREKFMVKDREKIVEVGKKKRHAILPESMLEGMAEYYSAELAEKVGRGMTENALKCKFNGGTVPIGYTINKDQFFEVDPVKAPYVVQAFEAYANGKTIKEIVDMLNAKGVTTSLGSKISINIVTDMLKNRRYIGEYKFRDIVQKDGIPRIVPQALFDKVQIEREKNKRAAARHKAKDDYLLTNQSR